MPSASHLVSTTHDSTPTLEQLLHNFASNKVTKAQMYVCRLTPHLSARHTLLGRAQSGEKVGTRSGQTNKHTWAHLTCFNTIKSKWFVLFIQNIYKVIMNCSGPEGPTLRRSIGYYYYQHIFVLRLMYQPVVFICRKKDLLIRQYNLCYRRQIHTLCDQKELNHSKIEYSECL